jgi:AcrR family transcriptional regulator
MVGTETPPPLAVEAMTSGQLIRRARLIEAVIELVREAGPAAVQMRDVADRSGIALGTAYRYFSSKEHLLAAAMCDWHERLARRMLSARLPRPVDQDEVVERVLGYVRRELRGFQRHPELAALMVMVQVNVSGDANAREALDRMATANNAVLDGLLHGVGDDRSAVVRTLLSSVLMNGLIQWTTGRVAFAEMAERVEAASRFVVSGPDLTAD